MTPSQSGYTDYNNRASTVDMRLTKTDGTEPTGKYAKQQGSPHTAMQPPQRALRQNISKWEMSGPPRLPIQFLGIYPKQIIATRGPSTETATGHVIFLSKRLVYLKHHPDREVFNTHLGAY